MRMKKTILAIVLTAAACFQANAQDYRTGIGGRVGVSSGFTVKHFLNSSNAIEGILSSRWGGFEFTGLYEFQQTAFNTPRLNWYFGGGFHIGSWGDDNHHWKDETKTIAGLDGIIGLEYNFTEIPINISLDWKPMLNIWGDTDFWADGVGLSIRYIF